MKKCAIQTLHKCALNGFPARFDISSSPSLRTYDCLRWVVPRSLCLMLSCVPQEYREKHVGFCDDDSDEPIDIEGKLRRRDTPHHLKNKRINSMETPESAEEKVRAILAAVGQKRPGTPPPPKVCGRSTSPIQLPNGQHLISIFSHWLSYLHWK